MKITDYAALTAVKAGTILLTDGDEGTKKITASVLAKGLLALMNSNTDSVPAANDKILAVSSKGALTYDADSVIWDLLDQFGTIPVRRMNFRGKNLGTSITEEQMATVKAGTFKGLFVGDYWVINSVNWRIADFDYWYNTGDTAFTTHHLVIVPDSTLYSAQMNSTNITTGAYVGSEMYTTNLEQAKTTITEIFGDYLLTHRAYLQNAVTNGYSSGEAWFDSTVELMNECMVYGHRHFGDIVNGTSLPSIRTVDKTQFALFTVYPRYINTRGWYWLRDVVSSTGFANVFSYGTATCFTASTSNGVRPCFAIG